MPKLSTYSSKGLKGQAIDMPKEWQSKSNLNLLAQAVRVYEDRSHPGLAKVKTRGEVKISTRKIYRQKGTGFARHGAKSAPIFVGGGVTHGPRGVKRSLLLSKYLKRGALKVAFGFKANEGEVVIADLTDLKKTKEAQTLLKSIVEKDLEGKWPTKITFALSKENSAVKLALRNLKNTKVALFSNLNAYQVFAGGLLIIDKKEAKSTKVKGSKKPVKKVVRAKRQKKPNQIKKTAKKSRKG